jgi:hypothetical protein
MKKIASVLILLALLSSCKSSWFKPEPFQPLEIACKEVEKPKLQVVLPSAVSMDKLSFSIMNADNYEEVVNKYKDDSGNVFLVVMGESDYKALAANNAKILKFIRQQTDIIKAYKEYYESSDNVDNN